MAIPTIQDRRSGDTTPSPVRSSATPVDPVHLAAELEIRLTHQGSAPGVDYRRPAAIAAVEAYLRAADIPMVGAA